MVLRNTLSQGFAVAATFLISANASPLGNLGHELKKLVGRETACIALGNCPGENPPPTTTTAPPPPPPPPTTNAAPVSSQSPAATGNATAAGQNPIKKGYTAFGDSFGAGIGTGTTEGSGCRKGEFSYPKQIASTVQNIDFQNLPCSGATVKNVLSNGPDSQVDAWQNAGNADIATISIGGNDIGFYNILTACVLWVGGPFAGDCDTEVNKAYGMLRGQDLYNDIVSALKQIIDKNGNEAFKVYMSGYPAFFNTDTTICDRSSFRIYNPHHDNTGIERGEPWLTQALRSQLNGLVTDLNTFLLQVVGTVNNYYRASRVSFVDPNPAFNNHRWCEEGVYDPDSSRMDTWFFLGSWGDNSLPGDASGASDSDNQQQADQLAGNTTALPDPTTCKQTLQDNGDHDWYDNMECDIAIAIQNKTSLEYQVISEGFVQVQDKNLTTLQVPWYIPTRLAKTFHPRTLGQQGIAQSIMNVW